MKQRLTKCILFAFLSLWLIIFETACTMEKKKIYRNLDIELMFFDCNRFASYQEILMSLDKERLFALLKEMDSTLKIQKSGKELEKIDYNDIFAFDGQFKESSLETYEYIQQSYIDQGELVKSPGFDILQYVMLYACTAINKDKFYYNFVYNPPSQFTSLFSDFYKKWNDAGSVDIETFNPYLPYCKDPGIEEGVHYVILPTNILKLIIERLEKLKLGKDYGDELENDYLFLEQALKKAKEEEWKIIIRIAP